MKFWDKVHNKQSESPTVNGMSPEILEEWTDVYQEDFVEWQTIPPIKGKYPPIFGNICLVIFGKSVKF